MLIGVFSDIHDNLEKMHKALQLFANKNIDTVLFCGDWCSPIPVKESIKFKGTIHTVWGNTEDRYTITKLTQNNLEHINIHGESAELEFDNRKVAMTHYPTYARSMAKINNYDAVFFGHIHQVVEEKYKNCICVNPGEILGYKGNSTCGVYNSDSNSVEIIEL